MDALDTSFLSQTDRDSRKILGQFLTPRPIAALMAEWVSASVPEEVLDPAVGTGILLDEVHQRAAGARLVGYDVDPVCLQVAGQRLRADLRLGSFLATDPKPIDAVIANPPYIRHHDIEHDAALHARLSGVVGEKLSKLTNIYALFLVECLARLRPGGVAAFLVPAEFANANFAAPVKSWILRSGLLKRVIYYDPSKLAFDDNLSTGCLLLFRNDRETEDVEVAFTDPDERHVKWDAITADKNSIVTAFPRDVLEGSKKWNYLVQVGAAADERPGMIPLRDLARTKRGIATGANGFFLRSAHEFREIGVFDQTVPCVGKSKDVKGLIFSEDDFRQLEAAGAPTRLLSMTEARTEDEIALVRAGEQEGLHKKYLTSKRKPWFSPEQQEVAPIWAAVFGRGNMRFVANDAKVRTLTTFHCVYPFRDDLPFVHALVACLNSDVVQSASLAHQRAYGGGLQKFEPRDLLDIRVPDLRLVSDATLMRLASVVESRAPEHMERLDDLVVAAISEAEGIKSQRLSA